MRWDDRENVIESQQCRVDIKNWIETEQDSGMPEII